MTIPAYMEFKTKQAAVEAANAKIMSLRSAIEDATGEPALTARCLNFSQFSPQAAADLISKLESELTAARVKKPEVEITATPPAPKPPRMRAQLPAQPLHNKAATPPTGPSLAQLEALATRIFGAAFRSWQYDDLNEPEKLAYLRREFFQAHIEIPGGMTADEAKARKIWRIPELTGLPKAVRHARQEVADKFFQNKNHEGA